MSDEIEWGPWVEDRLGWINHEQSNSQVEYREGEYVRHRLPARKIEVGKTYTSENGKKHLCLFVRDCYAWMQGAALHTPETAYVWHTKGKAVSLKSPSGEYDVDWEASE